MLSPGCDHRFIVWLTCGHFHDACPGSAGSPACSRGTATRGDEVGLRLEPGGCNLFPAGDSGTSAVKEYASA
jgi:hypothetical protein